jgi:hypothetical protein
MASRGRRGESSRLLPHGEGSSRQTSSKVVEADGTPLVDKNALKALIRLLRIVQVLLYLRTTLTILVA